LEEVIISVATHQEYSHLLSRINREQIYDTSKLVSRITQIPIAGNKAIVGSNVYTHYSGIHQDGVLKEKGTYEIIDPESIGAPQSKIDLSARSGKTALKYKLEQLGLTYQQKDLGIIYQRFVKIADKKNRVSEEDLCSIVEYL
jgi:Isopropylmalate/homocitrate/citramalate synthases